VSQSYNHSTYLNQRIEIMAWWSEHIEKNSIADGLYKERELSALADYL